jgi:Glycosyltransferase 61
VSVAHRIRRVLRRLAVRRPKAKPAAQGLRRRIGADGQPVGRMFRNIVVVPGTGSPTHSTLIDGGPIWPDFERQTRIRHLRRTKPVDKKPTAPSGPIAAFEGPAVWGGVLFMQFGHLCVEYTTRILWSRHRWPDATYLFIAAPGMTGATLPGYCWSILEWLGLRREQVRIVTEPVQVRELRVMPQAETLNGRAPPRSYLDLLDVRVRENGLIPIEGETLYVTRVGMLGAGSGANAGESYIQRLFVAAGIAVMDPAATPFREQLERYAGAKTLVFAEGAAVHGRQLIGRVDQRIFVMNRRINNGLGRTSLIPRCRAVRYFKVTRALAKVIPRSRRDMQHRGVSFYDVAVVAEVFAALGIEFDGVWNDADYRAARDADVRLWLSRLDPWPETVLREETIAALRPIFEAEGVSHLLPRGD